MPTIDYRVGRALLIIATAAALTLTTGCGHSATTAAPAPATSTLTADASGPAVRLSAIITSGTNATSSAFSAATTSAPPPMSAATGTNAASSVSTSPRPSTGSTLPPGAPTNDTRVDHPAYPLTGIDRRSAVQVAYAYLTLRLSYSWHDAAQGAGIRRAAAYADPAQAAAMTHNVPTATTTGWETAQRQHVSAVLAVTNIELFAPLHPGTSRTALAVLTWQQTTSSITAAATISSGNTTMTLRESIAGTWSVIDDSFGHPS